MNVMDEITEFFLYVFDLAMNILTLGAWSAWQGSKVPEVKVKKTL